MAWGALRWCAQCNCVYPFRKRNNAICIYKMQNCCVLLHHFMRDISVNIKCTVVYIKRVGGHCSSTNTTTTHKESSLRIACGGLLVKRISSYCCAMWCNIAILSFCQALSHSLTQNVPWNNNLWCGDGDAMRRNGQRIWTCAYATSMYDNMHIGWNFIRAVTKRAGLIDWLPI